MAKDRCRFHPNVSSSGTCKQCGIPLCDACKIVRAEGVFCSGPCWEQFVAFQKRISAHRSVRRGFLPALTWKKALIVLAALAALLMFMHYAYDVNSPGDVPSAIGKMWADFRDLFRR